MNPVMRQPPTVRAVSGTAEAAVPFCPISASPYSAIAMPPGRRATLGQSRRCARLGVLRGRTRTAARSAAALTGRLT
jgi:hypothetical protein